MLLVIEDLLAYDDYSGITALFTMHSHHLGVSLMVCCQNCFYKSAKLDLCTLNRNLTGWLVLQQRSDALMLRLLNNRLFPDRKNFIAECLDECEARYGTNYVFVNVSPHSGLPRRFMLYSCLLDEERAKHHGSPIFFSSESSSASIHKS